MVLKQRPLVQINNSPYKSLSKSVSFTSKCTTSVKNWFWISSEAPSVANNPLCCIFVQSMASCNSLYLMRSFAQPLPHVLRPPLQCLGSFRSLQTCCGTLRPARSLRKKGCSLHHLQGKKKGVPQFANYLDLPCLCGPTCYLPLLLPSRGLPKRQELNLRQARLPPTEFLFISSSTSLFHTLPLTFPVWDLSLFKLEDYFQHLPMFCCVFHVWSTTIHQLRSQTAPSVTRTTSSHDKGLTIRVHSSYHVVPSQMGGSSSFLAWS